VYISRQFLQGRGKTLHANGNFSYFYTLPSSMHYLAYIDQGSGSLLFQALLSGFLTIAVFFRRIRAWFSLKSSKDNKQQKN
jgi:hypothetical protein